MILGLHNCQDRTIVHMHARGPMCDMIYGPDELYARAMIWIRDMTAAGTPPAPAAAAA